jgi:hypothetical protein
MTTPKGKSSVSESMKDVIGDVFQSSGVHQAREARQWDAAHRIIFGFFVLAVSGGVFLFGMSLQDSKPIDAIVIKSLSAIPFLGAAWHLHFGLKSIRTRARQLQAKADEAAQKAPVRSPNAAR